MEAPLGLGAVAASNDSANSWTATVPLGLGSRGLDRGEPSSAVSTVITSPCVDAACLRSSEMTGQKKAQVGLEAATVHWAIGSCSRAAG